MKYWYNFFYWQIRKNIRKWVDKWFSGKRKNDKDDSFDNPFVIF